MQAEENPDGVEKRRAIAGIRCDKEALKQIKALFSPADWTADAPYCSFHFTVGGQELEGVFRMNEAALSKMDPAWLLMQKIALEKALIYRDEEEESYRGIFFYHHFIGNQARHGSDQRPQAPKITPDD